MPSTMEFLLIWRVLDISISFSLNPAITSVQAVLGGKPLRTNLMICSGLGLKVYVFTIAVARFLFWSQKKYYDEILVE